MVLLKSQKKLNKGDQAPDFSLTATDGKTYSLGDFLDKKGLLIIFMCNHCPYVQTKIEAIKNLHQKFFDKINIVGINSNDPDYPDEGMDNMKKYANDWGLPIAYLLDDTQEVAKKYGAVCTPDPFLFDEKGNLVFHGRIDNAMSPDAVATQNTMEIIISKMLNNEQIGDEILPSQGCSIKWKG